MEETSLGNDSPEVSRETSTEPLSYSGPVETPHGEPIAGAKIWLAVTSHEFNSEVNLENREGLLRELAFDLVIAFRPKIDVVGKAILRVGRLRLGPSLLSRR